MAAKELFPNIMCMIWGVSGITAIQKNMHRSVIVQCDEYPNNSKTNNKADASKSVMTQKAKLSQPMLKVEKVHWNSDNRGADVHFRGIFRTVDSKVKLVKLWS